MATIYGEFGNYEMSLDMLLKSKELNAKLPGIDLRAVIINKQKMGNLYLKTRDYPFAEKLIREATLEFKENNFLDAYYSSLIGYIDALNKLEQFQRADSVITAVLPEVENFGNAKLLAYYYTIYGNQLFGVGKLKEAKKYFERGYAVYTDSTFSDFPKNIFVQYLNFLQKTNQSKLALDLLNKHQESFENLKYSFEDRLYYHNVFYQIYLNLGLYNQAITELITKDNIRDSIEINKDFSLNKFSNSQYFLDYYENLFREKDSSNALLKRYFGFSIAFSILIVFSLGWILYRSKKHQKILHGNQQDFIHETNHWKNKYHDLLQLSQEQLKRDNTNKIKVDKYLSPQSLMDFLENNSVLTDDQKSQIQNYFIKQYADKVSKLKALDIKFTKNEILFCLYIFHGLKSKDIVKILNISAQSVATKKMRLSKKFELTSSSDLNNHLQSLLS
jgi:DNA-binding CsgD family transcriptional regulator